MNSKQRVVELKRDLMSLRKESIKFNKLIRQAYYEFNSEPLASAIEVLQENNRAMQDSIYIEIELLNKQIISTESFLKIADLICNLTTEDRQQIALLAQNYQELKVQELEVELNADKWEAIAD